MAQEGSEIPQAETDTPEERAKAYSDFRTAVQRIFDDNPSCMTTPSSLSRSFEDQMAVDTQGGKRVLLSRVKPGQKSPEDFFLQDVVASFPNEATGSFKDGQVDYTYDPKDGTVKKRIIDITKSGRIPSLSGKENPDEVLLKAKEASKIAMEWDSKLKLEEEMKTNNQPISAPEAKRITSTIARSTPV